MRKRNEITDKRNSIHTRSTPKKLLEKSMNELSITRFERIYGLKDQQKPGILTAPKIANPECQTLLPQYRPESPHKSSVPQLSPDITLPNLQPAKSKQLKAKTDIMQSRPSTSSLKPLESTKCQQSADPSKFIRAEKSGCRLPSATRQPRKQLLERIEQMSSAMTNNYGFRQTKQALLQQSEKMEGGRFSRPATSTKHGITDAASQPLATGATRVPLLDPLLKFSTIQLHRNLHKPAALNCLERLSQAVETKRPRTTGHPVDLESNLPKRLVSIHRITQVEGINRQCSTLTKQCDLHAEEALGDITILIIRTFSEDYQQLNQKYLRMAELIDSRTELKLPKLHRYVLVYLLLGIYLQSTEHPLKKFKTRLGALLQDKPEEKQLLKPILWAFVGKIRQELAKVSSCFEQAAKKIADSSFKSEQQWCRNIVAAAAEYQQTREHLPLQRYRNELAYYVKLRMMYGLDREKLNEELWCLC